MMNYERRPGTVTGQVNSAFIIHHSEFIIRAGPACRWRRLTLARSVWWVRLPSGPLWLDDEKRLESAAGVSAAPCVPPIGGWATRKADSKRRMSGRCGIVRDLTVKRTTEGSWSNGRTPVRQTGNPGSIPGGSTETEGSRIRFAGPVC